MRLLEVFQNLIGNAIKHGRREGRIEVATQILPAGLAQSGAPFVLVSVRDDGPGIAPDDRAHVFDRFYRSPKARNRPGNGIGLAIVRDIAQSYGGSLTIGQSALGGARITVDIPPAASRR